MESRCYRHLRGSENAINQQMSLGKPTLAEQMSTIKATEKWDGQSMPITAAASRHLPCALTFSKREQIPHREGSRDNYVNVWCSWRRWKFIDCFHRGSVKQSTTGLSLFTPVDWCLGWLVLEETGPVASTRLSSPSGFNPQHLWSNFSHHLYSDCQPRSWALGGV